MDVKFSVSPNHSDIELLREWIHNNNINNTHIAAIALPTSTNRIHSKWPNF